MFVVLPRSSCVKMLLLLLLLHADDKNVLSESSMILCQAVAVCMYTYVYHLQSVQNDAA